MLIESIGYTAMLVDYIARTTHLPVAVIAKTIGEAVSSVWLIMLL